MDRGAWWAAVHGATKSWTLQLAFCFVRSALCIPGSRRITVGGDRAGPRQVAARPWGDQPSFGDLMSWSRGRKKEPG